MASNETWYGEFIDFAGTEKQRKIYFRLHVPSLFFDPCDYKDGKRNGFIFARGDDDSIECAGITSPQGGSGERLCKLKLSKYSTHLQVYNRQFLLKEETYSGQSFIELHEGERFLAGVTKYWFVQALTQMFIQ